MNKNEALPRAYEPAEVEKYWFPRWEEMNCFHGEPNSGKPGYSIVIPPPNVTGILTLGHVLNNTLQDILCRRARMKGFEVCWFPGTDHAGIATEARVVKYLKQKENVTRDELGREEFIKRVWQWKEEFGGKIIKQLRTLGCSCDWERERFTMDEGLSEAVKKVFVQLYEKGYIYRGQRMINWCPAAKSALSDEEVIYKDVPGKFWYFRYPVVGSKDEYVVVATTRPETMFGDTAVAVHPEDPRYKHLIGKFVHLPLTDRDIPVIADQHADPTKGTGCVKITPAHDPNDFAVGQRHHLEVINIMNPDATLNDFCGPEFAGMDRFAAREKCVKMLKEQGLVEKIEDIVHAVGYSERGDVPIETLVSSQWFCKMGELAKPAIEAVKSGKIKFYPERWSKTYFHWMENIQDWCISRQLWWGHRIPAWYNDEKPGEIYVGIEPPTAPGKWRQEEDVLDTWFSSWLWPFSIMGWPEKTNELGFFYPTNDLVTGPDIIFFWVARMIMAGCEFMGRIPFNNVYFTSIIRDEKGRKLSKSLGNSPDPLDVIAEYGADALRFSIIYIAPLGMDIRYSNEKCEIGRNFANKLWNACRFRQMQGASAPVDKLPEGLSDDEKWMTSRLDAAIGFIEAELEGFRFHTAAHALYDLVWSDFCDWFVEAEKLPMRAGGADKERALAVLDWALFRILKLLHPFMPFVTEELAHRMGFVDENKSLMYEAWPVCEHIASDAGAAFAEEKFELVKGGRFLRSSYNIPDGRKLKFHIKAAGAAQLEALKNSMESLKLLLNAEEIEISQESFDSAKFGAAPSKLCAAGVISLPLAGLIDVDAERVKLTKELAQIDKWIAGTAGKLKNERFVQSAPAQVVADARAQLAELESRRTRTAELLEALK